MEPKNKVYINPNFKRVSKINTGSSEESKTTYFNKYFPQELTKKQMYHQDDANSRRIYVNPNFISGKNAYYGQGAHVSDHYIRNYNSAMPTNHSFVNEDQTEIRHSSNYGMLQNKNSTHSHVGFLEQPDTRCMIKQNYTNNKVILQPVNNLPQTPLSKSRYSIVRNKSIVSPTMSKVSLNNVQVIPQNKVNIFTYSCTGSSTSNKNNVCNNQKIKSCNITPQKITKIKISKYKTIPISYLKSNLQISVPNKIKPSNSATQPYNKVLLRNVKLNSTLLATYNKNRFKFVKSKTLVGLISDNKAVFKTSPLKLKRNLSLNKSKINVKANFKINNIPCRLFTKFGKCLRKDYGKCEYLHDKKHVSLCRKFLKGICHDITCTLSHELSATKMPTCYFYLKGMCTKEQCPYLHIKHSETTKICVDFIKGYCEKGDKCLFRHVKKQVIKSQLNTSSRSQQKRIIKNKNVQIKLNHKKVYKKNENKTELQDKNESDCRYYDDSMNNESSCEIIKPTRCKLGTLPSFIQL